MSLTNVSVTDRT